MTEFLTGFLGKKTFRDSYSEIICRPDALADAVTTKQLRENSEYNFFYNKDFKEVLKCIPILQYGSTDNSSIYALSPINGNRRLTRIGIALGLQWIELTIIIIITTIMPRP